VNTTTIATAVAIAAQTRRMIGVDISAPCEFEGCHHGTERVLEPAVRRVRVRPQYW
jgi:hypothetical protein